MTTEQTKTLWKKNLDSRYISGEDLQMEFHGLRKEMIVQIERFNDTDTFDQNTQTKKTATGLYLKEVTGTPLYKPVILNTTNAKFFTKETGSPYMEDWIGHTVMLYAQKDSRHGYVVRFKKYVLPYLAKSGKDFDNCYKAIHTSGYTMDQIKKKYQVTPEVEGMLMQKGGADATV